MTLMTKLLWLAQNGNKFPGNLDLVLEMSPRTEDEMEHGYIRFDDATECCWRQVDRFTAETDYEQRCVVHDPCGLVRSKPSCIPGCRMPRAVSAGPRALNSTPMTR